MISSFVVKIACYALILIVLCIQSNASTRLCGKQLPEALDSICINGFNSKIKKSMDLDDYAYNELDDELPFPYANSPFISKVFGGSANLMAKTRRRRHGVYDECCRKPCTYQELRSYCL